MVLINRGAFNLEISVVDYLSISQVGAKVIKYAGPYFILNVAFILINFVHSRVRHFEQCLQQIEITFISSKTFGYVLQQLTFNIQRRRVLQQADNQQSAVKLVDEPCSRLIINQQQYIELAGIVQYSAVKCPVKFLYFKY